MTPFVMSFFLFGGGLALLLFSGDVLTRTSVRLANLLHINPLIAGLTITAFATSAPEAAVAIEASLAGTTDIALGNVIGSNIANILLVLGFPAIFVALNTDIKQLRRHLIMMVGASLLFLFFALLGGIERLFGVLFLVLVVTWVVYSFRSGAAIVADEVEEEAAEEAEGTSALARQPGWIALLGVAAAAVGLWGGATLTLLGSQSIAAELNISHAVVGLTLIAIGTSLPELATSVAALWQKQNDIAIGNILGSNLLNILFVLGISAMIVPLPIDKAFLQLDILVMLGATLLIAPFIWFHRPLSRTFGWVFVGLYGLYLISLAELRPSLVG